MYQTTVHDDALETFLSVCSDASDQTSLWHAILAFFRSHGAMGTVYLHLPPLGAPDLDDPVAMIDGMTDAFRRRYVESGQYRIDPAAATALSTGEPVYHRSAADAAPRDHSGDADPDADTGQGTGKDPWFSGTSDAPGDPAHTDVVLLPTFGPGGRAGLFGLTFGPSVRPPLPDRLLLMRAGAQAAHMRYCDLVRSAGPSHPALSDREREMLQWVAQGKSNAAIAEIMNISPHTVDAYLRRAFAKMGTKDRISTVVRALGSGIITGHGMEPQAQPAPALSPDKA